MLVNRVVLARIEILGWLARARGHQFVVLFIGCALVGASAVAARQAAPRSPAAQVITPATASLTTRLLSYSAAAFDVSATPVTSISAASFEGAAVAPGSIVAAFGANLAIQTVEGTDTDPNTRGVQLPTQLANTTVEVNGRRAGLFFVSPGQVNYVMPPDTESGTASVVIRSGNGTQSNGTVEVVRVAPGIFTANSDGRGVPAASVLRVKNGVGQYEPLAQRDAQANRFVTKAINLGGEGETVFLVLYLTGLDKAQDDNGDGNVNESVRVLLGGAEITPDYVGRLADFVGLSQLNMQIPRTLLGRGIVNLSVVATGFRGSNLIDLEIAGSTGNAPPQIDSFGDEAALAGQEIAINGRGFADIFVDNTVRIAGLDAQLVAASPTQLRVMVPFGVQTGPVSVRTLFGEGISAAVLPVRTSISGTVETTSGQPLSNVTVSIPETPFATLTSLSGVFVLPDVPGGVPQEILIDGGSVGTNPPFPKFLRKVPVFGNRDNNIARSIALQQITGSSGTIGSGSSGLADGFESQTKQASPDQQTLAIITGDYHLELPATVTAAFPGGATRGAIYLTPLKDGRTPVDLPVGYYSSSVVQITPFNVRIDPGAKLIFPNTEGFPAGTPATLFRYDSTTGQFVEDAATATVSADGRLIETESNAIKTTSYYFAAVRRSTTTITGRVLEKNGQTPVNHALVNIRGREAYTDGNGGYILRDVPVKDGETIVVDVRAVRANLRVDRAQSAAVPAVLGGTTKVPDVLLPSTTENRPPAILISPSLGIDAGKTTDISFVVSDPDADQTVQVDLDGASFASLVRPTAANPLTYLLRLSPSFTQTGKYTLVLTATDSLGASVKEEVALTVRKVNGPPTAITQAVSGDEDNTIAIKLEATDRDGDKVTFSIVTPPLNGTLSGSAPNLVYKPALNFNGKDQFTFKANDGALDSAVGSVNITINPVNDAPVLTVAPTYTVNEGQQLNFTVSVFDPDQEQMLVMEATGLPLGASFTPITPTSWQFRWTPNLNQAGSIYLVFKVTDDGTPQLSDTKDTKITVNNVPLFSAPPPITINEGQTLAFDIAATEGLPVGVTFSTTDLPPGAQVTNNANQLHFAWTPNATQSGSYLVGIRGTVLGFFATSETRYVSITVLDTQRDLSKEATPLTIFGAAGAVGTLDRGDGFGTTIAIGDLNGDGLPDLVVGAPSANSGSQLDAGKTYVFFNRFDQSATIDLAQQRASLELAGERAGDGLGAALAIGDVNGDGKNDLIIGAPTADADSGRPDSGKVYVIYGPLAAGSESISQLARVTLLGAARDDRFGAALAVGAFHSKTGPLDLFIGAPRVDVVSSSDGATLGDAGAVYGYFGGSNPTSLTGAAVDERRDASLDAASLVLTGGTAGAQIGTALSVGNFNGDDLADLAVGAPMSGAGNLKASGAVWLVAGNSNLTGNKTIATAAAFTLAGAGEGDGFGAVLAFGDLNGDGRADLMIGAPGADSASGSQFDVGRAYVLLGSAELKARPFDVTVIGAGGADDAFPDALGSSVAAGDFNGDGLVDLIIGAPGADPVDAQRPPTGGVHILFGSRTLAAGTWNLATKPVDYVIWGADAGDALGAGSMAVGTLNSGELNKLMLGAPKAKGATNTKLDAGELRVINSVRR